VSAAGPDGRAHRHLRGFGNMAWARPDTERRIDVGARPPVADSSPLVSPAMPFAADRPLAAEGDDGRDRPREFIQSLERGLAIIRAFGPTAPEQSVGQIAGRTGLTRATARRFLITLTELGYVETDGRLFRLTPKVLELGYSFLSGLRFADVTLPHLERLVAEVDEDSEASILYGDDVVYVARVPSSKMMTVPINVGGRMPAHTTAMGKALLAALPDDQLEAYLATAGLPAYLPRTVTDPAVLRGQLALVREAGYAIVDQELEEGLIAIATVVRDRSGTAVGAINLSTNILRRTVDSLREELREPLLRTARLIEQDLSVTA
jgi:IclR family transcriptional regulator, pca regulon regulatory protein